MKKLICLALVLVVCVAGICTGRERNLRCSRWLIRN